jgi:aminopeptidase YwaD
MNPPVSPTFAQMLPRSILIFPCLLLAIGHLYAQDMDYAREVLAELCSDEMAGRGYVDDGDNSAAFYIESQFKEMELKSWDYNFYQSFTFAVNTFPGVMELGLDNQPLAPGRDFIVASDAPSIKGTYPIHYLNQLPKLAPSGRLLDTAFVYDGALVVPDSLVRGLPASMRSALLQGFRKAGAKVLLRATDKKLTWHVSTHQAAIFEATVHDSLFVLSPKTLQLAIESKMVPKHRTQNVLAYMPGTTDTDSTIVFTAHYDHLGKMGKEAIFRGANDNASGVTMLLSLAKHFSLPENASKFNIAFIAFAGEEVGLLGSSHYVEQPVFPLENIRFLINLDIVGTGEEGVKVVNGAVHIPEFDRLLALNASSNYLPAIQPRGKAAISDHYPFSEKGVPCFYFYTLGGSPAYHDVNDRPEGLSLAGFEGLFKLLVDFTHTF